MRVSVSLFLLLFASQAATAGELETPSLALLEYLGEWQDEDGNDIDPQALALLSVGNTVAGGNSDDEE